MNYYNNGWSLIYFIIIVILIIVDLSIHLSIYLPSVYLSIHFYHLFIYLPFIYIPFAYLLFLGSGLIFNWMITPWINAYQNNQKIRSTASSPLFYALFIGKISRLEWIYITAFPSIYLSIHTNICEYTYICPQIYRYKYLSIYLCVHISIYLSFYLSVYSYINLSYYCRVSKIRRRSGKTIGLDNFSSLFINHYLLFIWTFFIYMVLPILSHRLMWSLFAIIS
jgi:hypothetical protein